MILPENKDSRFSYFPISFGCLKNKDSRFLMTFLGNRDDKNRRTTSVAGCDKNVVYTSNLEPGGR